MSAPALVSRSQPIAKAQLDALAAYANEKNLGEIFSFNDGPLLQSDKWLSVLKRIRQLCIQRFKRPVPRFSPFLWSYEPSLITSGPWVLKVNDSLVSDKGYTEASASVPVTTDTAIVYKECRFATSIEYWTPRVNPISCQTIARVGAGVGQTFEDTWIPFRIFGPDQCTNFTSLGVHYPSLSTFSELTWSYKASFDKSCVWSGQAYLIQLNSTITAPTPKPAGWTYPPPDITLLGNSGATLQILRATGFPHENSTPESDLKNWFVYIEWSTNLSAGDHNLSFGIRINNTSEIEFSDIAHSESDFIADTTASNSFQFDFSISSTAGGIGNNGLFSPGIDSTRPISKFQFPKSSSGSGGMYVRFPSERTVVIDGQTYKSGENLAVITHSPINSSSSASKDEGVFIGKTYPVVVANTVMRHRELNLSGIPIVNPSASTRAPIGNPDINPVTPAIDFENPAYPIRHISEPDVPQGEASINRGTIVFKINIADVPVLDGDIYKYPSPQADIIQIGIMQNGSFLVFDTLQKNTNELEVYRLWPVFVPTKLVYSTSSGRKMFITANVVESSSDISARGQDFPDDGARNVLFPLMAEHFNETVQMLNAIT